MRKVGLSRLGQLLLLLGAASGCGKSSTASADSPVANGGAAGLGGAAGARSDAGAGAGGTDASGAAAGAAGGAAGSMADADPCPVPLADWQPVQGDVFAGPGNVVATHDSIVASSDAGNLLFPIAAESPEAMIAPIAIDTNIGSPLSAFRGDDALYVLGTSAKGALLSRVESSGHATTVDIPVPLQGMARGSVAQAGERVAVAGGDGTGNFVTYLFDRELGAIKNFALTKHSFGSLTVDLQGLRLAAVDTIGKALELYRVTDSELTLERSEPLADLPAPFTVAWVGDSVISQIDGKLVLVDPTGHQTNLEPPLNNGSNGVNYLSTSASELGNVLGASVDNAPFVGRLQNGNLEWAGPGGESGVFSDVRADARNLGVYYVATQRPRTLAYFGFRCPLPAP